MESLTQQTQYGLPSCVIFMYITTYPTLMLLLLLRREYGFLKRGAKG